MFLAWIRASSRPQPPPPLHPLSLAQNLALALASVAVATLPTLAGMFPLWLAVTLHEGSTLLVALNSLRLLLDAPAVGVPHSKVLQQSTNQDPKIGFAS